jgi:hypothetical protein
MLSYLKISVHKLLRFQTHNINDRNDHRIGGPSEDPAERAAPEPELLEPQVGLVHIILHKLQEKEYRDIDHQHKRFGADIIHIKRTLDFSKPGKICKYGMKVRRKEEYQ